MQKKQIKQAMKVVDSNYEGYKQRVEFLLLASQVYKQNQEHQQECKALQDLVKVDGKPRYIALWSEALTKVEDYPAALNLLHKVVDETDGKDPILFEVYKNMGNIYLKCGDIEAAEEKYNLANAIKSDDENLIVNYGVLAIQKEQYAEAKTRFAQALEVNDSSDLAWVGLALVHRAFADHDLARACLLRGLDENPYNKLAITNFYQWCEQDNVDTTDEIARKFTEQHPNDKEITALYSGMHQ